MGKIKIQNTFSRNRPLDQSSTASTRFLVAKAREFECYKPITWVTRLDDTYWTDNGGYNPPWAVWDGEKWIGDEFSYAIWLNPIGNWYQGQRPKWVRATWNTDAPYSLVAALGPAFENILPPLLPSGLAYDFRQSGEMYELDWSDDVDIRYFYVFAGADAIGNPAFGVDIELTNIEFGFPNRIGYVISDPVLEPDLSKKFASQADIVSGVNHSGDGIDIIPPSFVDDDFADGLGTVADTAKWTTILVEQFGGNPTNFPLRDGQDLAWYGQKIAENNGEEKFRVYANWHLPYPSNAEIDAMADYTTIWEWEFILDFDLLNITGQTSYFGGSVLCGVTWDGPTGGGDYNTFSRRPPWSFEATHRGGPGTSGIWSFNSQPLANCQPVPNRIAWRTKIPGQGYKKQSMHLFFDQTDQTWKNAYNQGPGVPWYSSPANGWDAIPYVEFSSSSIFRNYTNEIMVRATNFRLISGNWSF